MNKKRLIKTIAILLTIIGLTLAVCGLNMLITTLFGEVGYLIFFGACLIITAIDIYKIL